ncbi:MAG: hypothetical protein MZW92_71525 [Comamonadaceae bacterium]|nr:hypothetical protein [Comamonadaceae bacterium]
MLALSRIVQDDGDLRAINAVLVIPYFKSSKFAEYIYENIIRTFVASGREPFSCGISHPSCPTTGSPCSSKRTSSRPADRRA